MSFEDPYPAVEESAPGESPGSESPSDDASARPGVLDPVEGRVLGCLLEKERTTPDNYPLTLNSLRLACNQSTARHPVVSYSESTVADALASLRQKQLIRIVHSPSNRAAKYRHVIDEALELRPDELAVVCLLLLRGPQTVGELRTRSDRLADFSSLEEVEAALERLSGRNPPMARMLERRPGQKESRFAQLLAEEAEDLSGPVTPAEAVPSAGGATSDAPSGRAAGLESQIDDLRSELAELRRAVETLFDALGMPPP